MYTALQTHSDKDRRYTKFRDCGRRVSLPAPAAITEYHRLGSLKKGNLLLIVLEARCLRSRSQHGWVEEGTIFPVNSHVEGWGELRSLHSLIRALTTSWDSTCMPHPNLISSQWHHAQIPSHWGLWPQPNLALTLEAIKLQSMNSRNVE